jgi:hypothetical protein
MDSSTPLSAHQHPFAGVVTCLDCEERQANGWTTMIEMTRASDRDPDGFRYGWIRSVVDDHGVATDRVARGRLLRAKVETGRTLHPGDRVVFRCEGGDPYGRELRWWLHPSGDDRQPQVRGERVELTWIVPTSAVGQRVYVGIGMATDSRHHREGGPAEQGYDGWIVFYYRVLPATALWQSSRGGTGTRWATRHEGSRAHQTRSNTVPAVPPLTGSVLAQNLIDTPTLAATNSVRLVGARPAPALSAEQVPLSAPTIWPTTGHPRHTRSIGRYYEQS